METRRDEWIAAWPLLDALLPGATLFMLLLWLSWRFVHGGFGGVRHHAFAAVGRSGSFAARAPTNWWSCTCRAGACACLAAIARGLRQCLKLLPGERKLGWRMGLEPTTTGITIRDSTN